jgi:hypothetical protein
MTLNGYGACIGTIERKLNFAEGRGANVVYCDWL